MSVKFLVGRSVAPSIDCFKVSVLFLSVISLMVMTGSLLAKEDDGVRARVEAKWALMAADDFKSVYKFQTPNYRAVFPEALYIHKFSKGTVRRLTKIVDIKYDDAIDMATVSIVIEASGNAATDEAIEVQLKEKWLDIDGEWWQSSR